MHLISILLDFDLRTLQLQSPCFQLLRSTVTLNFTKSEAILMALYNRDQNIFWSFIKVGRISWNVLVYAYLLAPIELAQ